MNAAKANQLARASALIILREKISLAANRGQTQVAGYFGLSQDAAEWATERLSNEDGYRCSLQGAFGNIYVSIFWEVQ